MNLRRTWWAGIAGAALLGGLLAGCLPTAAPSPTPSAEPFAPTGTPAPTEPPLLPTATPIPTATPTPTPTLPPPPAVLRMNLGGEPASLDPAQAIDGPARTVVEQLFLSLTAFDPRSAVVVPELALSWESSEGGRVWTVVLRDNVRWVRYDPQQEAVVPLRPVTAFDVEYAIRRALMPETQAPLAHLLYPIRNAERIHHTAVPTETYAIEELGVRALDERTVRFELESPAAFFPAVLATEIARPLPQEAMEEAGESWAGPTGLWSNAAYALREWVPGDHITLVRNPHGIHAAAVQIDTIELALIADDAFAFAMYQNDELDTAQVPLEELERVQADPVQSNELVVAPLACVEFYGFSATRPPFDDARVRRAFSLAIDRQRLVDEVRRGIGSPANVLAPPMVLGSPAGDPQVGVHFDPDQAREELAQAGYADGTGFPVVVLLINEGEENERTARLIQQMWQEELGVEVILERLPWEAYLGAISAEAPAEELPHIWRMGWCGPYPDEHGWVHAVLHPEEGLNRSRLRADDPLVGPFAELTRQAAQELDAGRRAELYRQAEQWAVYELAAVAPLYYQAAAVVAKPYLERNVPPFGMPDLENWRVEPH